MTRFWHFLIGFILIAGMSNAQRLILHNTSSENPIFELRYLRANYNTYKPLKPLSGLYDLNILLPISTASSFEFSFPFHSLNYEDEKTVVSPGNVYVGLQTRLESSETKKSYMTGGIYLPSASNAPGHYFHTSFLNYYELAKYAIDYITFSASITHEYLLFETTTVRWDLGLQVYLYTDDPEGAFVILPYGAGVNQPIGDFGLIFEFLGILFGRGGDSITDNLVYGTCFGISWNKYFIKPVLFYQLNLSDNIADYNSIGFKLQYEFSSSQLIK